MIRERWKSYHEFSFWKDFEKILNRARFRCERCRSEDNLIFHHLDGYGFNQAMRNGESFSHNTVNNSPVNLLLLCYRCHSIIHGETYEARNIRIMKMRGLGWSFGAIGWQFKLSRQRLHQICNGNS